MMNEKPYVPLEDLIAMKKKLDAEESKSQKLINALVVLMTIDNFEKRKNIIHAALHEAGRR